MNTIKETYRNNEIIAGILRHHRAAYYGARNDFRGLADRQRDQPIRLAQFPSLTERPFAERRF